MSRGVLFKSLVALGLKQIDAEIYLLLVEEGPQKTKTLANALELNKQQLYRSLKRLQNKNIITVTQNRPALFSAVSPATILDFIIEAKKEQASALQENREELLSKWRAIVKKGFIDN